MELIIEIHNGLTWTKQGFGKSFLGVPKCASSGIREEFRLNETNDIKDVNNVFSVIREPIKRYVSGYIESMKPSAGFPKGRYFMSNINSELLKTVRDLYNARIDEVERFKLYTYLIKDNGFFEPHTVKQIDYLRDLDTKELFKGVEIFKLEKSSELNKFIGRALPRRNVCEHSNLKNLLTSFIESDSEFKNLLIELYQEDIDLYNSFDTNIKTN